jgi:HEAT repeat protein
MLLATVPTRESMERLRAMAGDSEAAVRQAVVGGLGQAPAGFDADSALRSLAADRDDGVRRGALFVGAKAGAAWALEALRSAAADRESPDRLAAMVSLGKCRDEKSVALLLSVAGDEKESPQARLTASNNLARIGDASVLPRLFFVAAAAAGALPDGGPLWSSMAVGLANFGAAAIGPAVDFYRAATGEREKRVVITVLRFLGEPNAEAARKALRVLLEDEKDPALRLEIEEALKK